MTTAPARAHPRNAGAATCHPKKKTTTTTTTTPPAVSAPTATSLNGATYQVADASYSLALSAKTGECWISATDSGSGNVLFTGVLTSGQSHTVTASGPVTVVAGAPAAFAATINGVPVELLFGFQAPFTFEVHDARWGRDDDTDDRERRGVEQRVDRLSQPAAAGAAPAASPRASSRNARTRASSRHAS